MLNGRFGSSFIVNFDHDGNVSQIWTQFGDMPTIKEMESINTYSREYLKKYKTQDSLDLIDLKRREAEDIEHIRKRQQEKEERALQKFQEVTEKPCDIYLIKDTIREVYKVGKAKNFSERFKQLKTANAGIELVAFYLGVPSDEKVIHSVYDSFNKRVSGEWFKLDQADIDYFFEYFVKPELPF